MQHSRPRPKPVARFAREDAIDVLADSLDPDCMAEVAADDGIQFRRNGVRDKTFRQLKRGQLRIQDEIDLHGMTSDEAYDSLKDFIGLSRAKGCRCIRVIHGKGHRSGHRGPVLKRQVAVWLRRFDDVLACCPARPMDGGDGAAVVLLRKA